MAANPFDFTGPYTNLQDIFSEKTKDTLRLLEQQGMRPDKAQDLFFDALEAPGVNAALRKQAIEVSEHGAANMAMDMGSTMSNTNLPTQEIVRRLRIVQPELLVQMLADTQQVSQQAIRIVRIKGKAANPLLREIAHETLALTEAERGSLVPMMGAFKRAYQRLKTAPPNPVPFDFSNAKDPNEIIFGTRGTFQELQIQGVRHEKAVDLFYDALEAKEVNGQLRQEVMAYLASATAGTLKKTLEDYTNAAGKENVSMKKTWLANAQTAAQHAVRLSKILGTAADRTLQEVAREMSVLPEAQRDSLDSLMRALSRANEQATQPSPVRRRPKGKPGHFDL